MWKNISQSLSGANEEQGESLLGEESGGLCSLSTTQVLAKLFMQILMFGIYCNVAALIYASFGLLTKQRIYGFAACLIAGLACMLLSMIVFAKPIKFAVLFTFGNLLAVGSTAFLLGPAQQLGMMFEPVRVFATAIYLGCVVVALICALLIHSKLLTIIAIIIEIGALIWYSLSYIPFARRMVSDLMIRLCDTEL